MPSARLPGTYKILITTAGPPPEMGLRLLRKAGAKLIIAPFKCPLQEDYLINKSKDVDAMIVGLTRITRKIIESAKKLKVIGRLGVGLENIDIDTATKKGILVTFAGDANVEAVAEHTICLILALSRNLLIADRMVRKGMWLSNFMEKRSLHELYGKILGIVGFGRIGQRVSQIAKIFGMDILVTDIVQPDPMLIEDLDAEFVPLDKLLKLSDVVTFHVPLTPKTRHIIGARELQLMKDGAVLINTSRGGVVDEKSLIRALSKGKISCAGLDVFELEPIKPENPLLEMGNVILTPHIAWYSEEARLRTWTTVVNDVLRVLRNETPKFPVNKCTLS